MNRVAIIYFVFFTCVLNAQVSPFNRIEVKSDSSGVYSFIASGHWHGSSMNQSSFPAATILGNIDLLNKSNAAFIITTGDLFLDVKSDIPNYQKSLFNKLKVALFNAPGNHDISGSFYEEKYGKTWNKFILNTELFIILNTEINDGSISGEQLNFLKDVLDNSSKRKLKNIFIFSHRPIWSEHDERLKSIFIDNTKSLLGNNFKDEILPILKKYSGSVNIYWFSGSLGGDAPSSFFYYKDKNGITFIQTAIRDLPRDAILKVKLNKGRVVFETISLTSNPVPKLESCDLEMWNRGPVSSFNSRLIPLYIKQMLTHRFFWYGIFTAIFSVFILRFVFRRFKHKKSAKA